MNPTTLSVPPVSRRWINWALLAAVFAVAAAAAAAINSLGRRADASRHVETTLARLEKTAFQLNALEWETLHKGKLGPELEESVATSRKELQKQFILLGEMDLKLPELEDVTERFATYLKFVDQEFKLLRAGEIKEAEEWDEAKVDPAFDELSEALNEAAKAFDVLALSSLKLVRLWTFAILFAAAAALGLLFWQYYQKQRTAEVAATEQRVLRQANEELESRVRERTAELVALGKQVGVAARQAGMAEVANSVLHNVGNALNSVNVSASLVLETLNRSRLKDLPAASQLLKEHAHDLGAFLTQDDQGRQFPGFLQAMASQWQTEHTVLCRESAELSKHIQHIREIVQRQQSISGFSGLAENVPLDEVIEQAVALNYDLLEKTPVQIRREIAPGLVAWSDRSKLTQIIVNLLRNAAQAIVDSGTKAGEIKVRGEPLANGRVLIHVTDNGPGISQENIAKLFTYGFTTKKSGHGFGLHGSALGAKEMGGSLRAHSDGPGCGATFTIELPAPTAQEAVRAA